MEGLKPLPPATPGCTGCAARDRQIARLEAIVEELRAAGRKLEATIEKQERRIQHLEERLAQSSRNSHRPPSSDPPWTPPKPPKPPTGRNPGGQPGHEGKNRGLLPSEEVKEVIHHHPSACEKCKKPFRGIAGPLDPPPLRHQIWELVLKLTEVVEHQVHGRRCSCGHVTRATLPEEIARSSFGPRLAATVALLTGVYHLSRRQTEEVVEDLLGVPMALGTVSNLEAEACEALDRPYQEAAEAVQTAPVKNLDETGWKQCGKRRWLWTAVTTVVAFFSIHQLRGEEGLLKLLGGKLLGIFTSDRWSAYRRRAIRFRQICWAHLMRDFQ